MNIRMTIKEIREKKSVSLRKLEKETGIEREYLADIENNKIPADEILLIEVILISNSLACNIEDLFVVENLEIKGIGEI